MRFLLLLDAKRTRMQYGFHPQCIEFMPDGASLLFQLRMIIAMSDWAVSTTVSCELRHQFIRLLLPGGSLGLRTASHSSLFPNL